jgi:hypothetical protein
LQSVSRECREVSMMQRDRKKEAAGKRKRKDQSKGWTPRKEYKRIKDVAEEKERNTKHGCTGKQEGAGNGGTERERESGTYHQFLLELLISSLASRPDEVTTRMKIPA